MQNNERSIFMDNENNEIVGNIKLRLDNDLKKLLKTSEKTGVPLRFSGDSILDFKVEGDSRYESNIKPDLAVEKEIVNLVDSILTKRINDEDTTEETKKIDSIVYQLYGLTDEEITLVETSI